jgi:hypothetical protein
MRRFIVSALLGIAALIVVFVGLYALGAQQAGAQAQQAAAQEKQAKCDRLSREYQAQLQYAGTVRGNSAPIRQQYADQKLAAGC